VAKQLRRIKIERAHPGAHNVADVVAGRRSLQTHPAATPRAGEPVFASTDEVVAHCASHRITHLIYTGYALNACVMRSPGGMIDLERAGVLCSVVSDAVVALENRETADLELAKQVALWEVSLFHGFVYTAADLSWAFTEFSA
jgi:hypothetical protein